MITRATIHSKTNLTVAVLHNCLKWYNKRIQIQNVPVQCTEI